MNNKRNRYIRIFIISFVLYIVLFFVCFFSYTNRLSAHQDKMFSDIKSLNKLSEYAIEAINEDEYLDDIIPVNKFTYRIVWNEKEFNVYAYEFENDLQCMQYTKNRKMPYYGNKSFHLSSNLFFSSKYIICSDNNLLYVDGSDINSLLDFLDYIGQDFDIIL